MTWIAARKRIPRRLPLPGARRRPGRPQLRAQVLGCWCVDLLAGGLHPVWHSKRQLVSVCGPVSTLCPIIIELDGPKSKPDWKALALKARFIREGFRQISFCRESEVAKLLLKRNAPKQAEFSFSHPDVLSD